jgi:hypothetical protein
MGGILLLKNPNLYFILISLKRTLGDFTFIEHIPQSTVY